LAVTDNDTPSAAPVPEPETLAMVLAGLGVLAALRLKGRAC
jgi:hypothetical protein